MIKEESKVLILLMICSLMANAGFGQTSFSELLQEAEKGNDELMTIYDLDVFEYYDLDEYETELQKKDFKKSDKYHEYLKELKALRNNMLKTIYYEKEEGEFFNTDYDVDRGGFYVTLKKNWGMGTIKSSPPNSISLGFEFVELQTLPTQNHVYEPLGDRFYEEKFFLSISEEDGLKIEKNRKHINIYFFFTPSGKKEMEYSFYSGKWYKMTDEVLTTNWVRIAVVNSQTNEVYYDKAFTQQGSKNYIEYDNKSEGNNDPKNMFTPSQETTEKKYEDYLDSGRRAINQNKLELAKGYFKDANKLKPESEVPERKIREVEQREKILSNKENKVYDYAELSKDEFSTIKREVEGQVLENLLGYIKNNQESNGFSFNGNLKFTIDTNANLELSNDLNIKEPELKNLVERVVKNIDAKPATKMGYLVNAKGAFDLHYSYQESKFSVKYSDKGVNFKDGDSSAFIANSGEIQDRVKSNPKGTYEFKLTKISVNDHQSNQMITIENYSGFGGAGNALLSGIMPGLGDHFVNKGKGSMLGKNTSPWITTLSVAGFIGSGLLVRNQAMENHDLYQSATQQSNINQYYKKANNQNKTAWTLMGIGGIIWLADIYWVTKTGVENKKTSSEFRDKIKLSVNPGFKNDNFTFGLKLNF